MYDAKGIGAFIARLRAEKGWTQRQLADRLHVTDKAVSKWERGGGYPDIGMISALASVLGVTETELLRGSRSEGSMEEVNGAVRGTLLYMQRAKNEGSKSLRYRVLGGGLLGLILAADICRNTDVAAHGQMTWSVYAIIAAVFLGLLLATACLCKKKPFWKTLIAGCVGIFPALYLALAWAGQQAAFLPTVLPVAFLAVLLVWAIVCMMTLDAGSGVLTGVLRGILLVSTRLLLWLILSILNGEATTSTLNADIMFMTGFALVLMLLPWPESMKKGQRL